MLFLKARRADLLVVEGFVFLILKFRRNGFLKKDRPDRALKIKQTIFSTKRSLQWG